MLPVRNIGLKLFDKDALLKEIVINKAERNYNCENGAIIFPLFASEGYGGYGLVMMTGGLYFNKDIDGSLLLKMDIKAGGLVFIIPVMAHHKDLIRWKIVK